METDVLVRVLSADRLGPYVAAMRSRQGGMRLYEWNLDVSAAFYETLSYLRSRCEMLFTGGWRSISVAKTGGMRPSRSPPKQRT